MNATLSPQGPAAPARAASAPPSTGARARFQAWFQQRIARRDTMLLTQRNVYILPTRAGLFLGVTLAVLLVASINFQLNLGYVLTFLLAGCALVGMHVCHGTLRGLTLNLLAPEAQFAGTGVHININLMSTSTSVRYGIGLSFFGSAQWSWTDVPAQGNARVQLSFQPPGRGVHLLPALTAETRFPLGTFRVWTIWRPATPVLVYPAPEPNAPALPPGQPRAEGMRNAQRQHSGEFDGVRAYRRGDPLKLVVWKKVAKADELVSRDAQQAQHQELWLDFAATGIAGSHGTAFERRLSRLCAWVLRAEKLGLPYGLRVGSTELAPALGDTHRIACLQALALAAP